MESTGEMIERQHENAPVSGAHLPEPVYESVVRSLYKDQATLLVGSLSMVAAPIVLYYRGGDPVQLGFAGLLLAIAIMRLVDGWMFSRNSGSPMRGEQISRWEMRYASLGAVHVGILGIWCLIGFARTSDDFVHMMSIALTLSYIVGIIGRNFSSESVVLSQTICSGVPMVTGVLLFTDIYHFMLALFLVPLFLAIWKMSRNLRLMLFSAVLTAIDNKRIADRFDVALANVSHGMAMIDGEDRIVVFNQNFARLCDLPESTDLCLLRLAEAGPGAVPPSKLFAELATAISERRRERVPSTFNLVAENARILEVKFNPMAEGAVVVIEDISERVSSEEAIRKLASFDPLTHLPNRRFFMHEVNRLLGSPEGLQPCVVLFVDLDNFKDVNDSLGHAIGDKLLCSIALRMRSRMPQKAMICRFGGDEFVLVIPGKMRQKECKLLAERLIAEISKPMIIDGHTLSVGASIGIAQCPANGQEYSQLLKVSDVALYDAKARGRGMISFYSENLGDQIRERRELENELRRAIERGQMQLHFQPLVNLERHRITTCEALLRWRHPDRGQISPAVFIPIAEEIGIISIIGRFVLEEAVRQCLEWPGNVSVAVNVSSLQFQQSDVYAVVSSVLAKSGLPPHRLEIEVTESAMLADVTETTEVLSKLAKLGVRISLDDFGTGFSSLSYLHALPLHKVKIDRSFIENIKDGDRSLVLLTGVTHLAKELGLEIVIEGIESAEQMELLCSKVHVDEMQGYLFGRAMPADDVKTLLTSQSGPLDRERSALAG